MTDLFQLADEPFPDEHDLDSDGCQCKPADNQYLLSVDEGQAVLIHAACGKQPPRNWGDWHDLVGMDPIPVTVEWEANCSGSTWHGDHRCDCDHWVEVSATSVPEDVRAAALKTSREHAAALLAEQQGRDSSQT
jgi:hypothetical protein